MNQLVDSLQVSEEEVKDLMKLVDRRHFTMDKSQAYRDSPSRLTDNQTISAPHMHARALDAMWPVLHEGAHILDIGSGSGYLTACFGIQCKVFHKDHRYRGKVIGLEMYPRLVKFSQKVIAKNYSFLNSYSQSFSIKHKDGKHGFPSKKNQERYDGIHIGAKCEEIPPYLFAQLKTGGIMVLPLMIHGELQFCTVAKDKKGKPKIKTMGRVNYVPLV